MDTVTLLILLSIFCVLLFLVGLPVFLVFATWIMGFAYLVPVFGFNNISLSLFESINQFGFLAITMYILIGFLISRTGLIDDIIEFSRTLVGWVPGSTGLVAIVSSTVLAAINGSNAATTAAIGESMHSRLLEDDYETDFAAATIAAGGILGVIIPPSVLFVIYGILFNISIPDMFTLAIVPGLLMALAIGAICIFYSYKNGYGQEAHYDFRLSDLFRDTLAAVPALTAIVVIVGGVIFGIFTAAESGIIGVIYIIILGVVLKGLRDPGEITHGIHRSAMLSGIIIPLVAVSTILQQDLIYLGLDDAISDFLLSFDETWQIIVLLIVIMLLTGMVLDSVPNLIFTAPILAPAAFSLGLTPLTWGIVFLMSDAIGYITPPYGVNLYVISVMTGRSYMKIAYKVVPYLAVLLVLWIAIFLFFIHNGALYTDMLLG